MRIPAVAILAWLTTGLSTTLTAADTNQPFPGITYQMDVRENPPERLFIVTVDLTDPRVRLRVSPGGPDPDGPGKWQTTLMRPTQIAAREHFDVVINGDFFDARGVKDAEGTNSQFRATLWGRVLGPAVTDGKTWATNETARPCLVITRQGKASFEMRDQPQAGDWQLIAGNTMLVENGKPVWRQNIARHPRTLLGLNREATKLWIVVVDGRKRDAVGLSYKELSEEMLRLGCYRALNLDGGGSSVLAFRDSATGSYRLLNAPTDGRERAVANVLGVVIQAR